ncbi:MAG: CpaF family protein [Candidatus Diapherotrites archaeon]|nr:CpaF family protein [Candidatus Diapherotrites archaeon]
MEKECLLGWKTRQMENSKKTLCKGKAESIIECNSGEKRYCVDLPELSFEESFLLDKIKTCFQETAGKKRELDFFIEDYCVENKILLDSAQFKYFHKILDLELFGFSVLSCFLDDENIEEIAVIGVGEKNPVFIFHKKFGWLKTNVFFQNAELVRDIVNKIARDLGRRLTMEKPKINATLPDGSRLTATLPPISKEPSVTIRKFRTAPFTPVELIENKTFSGAFCAFIWLAIELDCSFLIAGNTGSGKTSTLNCLLSFVPENERIIVIEETPEINLPHEHIISMTVVKEQKIGMGSLIIDTLRMRPDRVSVGEMRCRQEALAFTDTLLAGQGRGSYATFHAQSSNEAIGRLKSFGINPLDLNAIDLLIIQKRWLENSGNGSFEKRRIIDVSEILTGEKGIELNRVFEFDFGKDKLEVAGKSRRLMDRARDYLGLDEKGFARELKKRQGMLEKLCGKKKSLAEFFQEINKKKAMKCPAKKI